MLVERSLAGIEKGAAATVGTPAVQVTVSLMPAETLVLSDTEVAWKGDAWMQAAAAPVAVQSLQLLVMWLLLQESSHSAQHHVTVCRMAAAAAAAAVAADAMHHWLLLPLLVELHPQAMPVALQQPH